MDIEFYPLWTSEFVSVFCVSLYKERHTLVLQPARVIFTVQRTGQFIDWTSESVVMKNDYGMVQGFRVKR